MSVNLTKLAYQSFHQSKNYFSFAHKTITRQIYKLFYPEYQPKTTPLSQAIVEELQKRLNDLLEIDWEDAEKGIYPPSLLFENSWEDFFQYYPIVCFDLLQVWERIQKGRYQEFSPEIPKDSYPRYYLQNFHYQTDGYLSELSANLYDLQVELLFGGSTDAMRRRILAPLKHKLEVFTYLPQKQIRILDVACGTGRTLKLIRSALPQVSLYGTDLSPTYLKKANSLLSQILGELPQLVQANVEELPYRDDYFHATVAVFLFHELPSHVRQTVIEQCFRVTKPGGVFIICDSIQLSDAPHLASVMNNFYQTFHEPYYRHYMTDDLSRYLEKAGFENVETQVHFMSKFWVAHKAILC